MAQICDHIYLGSYETAGNKKQLTDWDIGCIINVARGCNNLFLDEFDYVRVPFEDDSYIPKNIIDCVVDQMHEYIKKKVNIFVHCVKGKSRSVFTIAYYLTKYGDYTSSAVLNLIKSKKTDVNMSSVFLEQLKEYENVNKNQTPYIISVPQSLIDRLKTSINTYNDKRLDEKNKEVTEDLYADISDETINQTILKHKRVKTIETYVKEYKKFPKFRQINYVISISKKTNYYHIPGHPKKP